MWQSWFISLLQLGVSLLEAFFSSKSNNATNHEDQADSNFFHSTSGRGGGNASGSGINSLALQRAYEILELTPPVTSMDQVRKQWKLLSRRNHPDRNQGSEESHKKQQEINEAMEKIQLALEGDCDGGDESDDGDPTHPAHDERSPEDNDGKNPPTSPFAKTPNYTKKEAKQKGGKQRKRKLQKQKRRHEEEMREYRKHLYAKMKEDMKKEREQLQARLWEELQRESEQNALIQETIEKIKRETSLLDDLEQRQASSRLFMSRVKHYREQQHRQQNGSESNHGGFERPKHYLMESCTNYLVVAMRLGYEELAAKVLDDEINGFIQEVWAQPHLHPGLLKTLANARGEVSMRQLYSEGTRRVLRKKLDEDDNTLLHYAVYWDCASMVRSLCDVAHGSDMLEELLYARDSHGTVPMDLAGIATNPDIMPVLQYYESLLNHYREQTHLSLATLKAMKQLLQSLRTRLDWVRVTNTILAYCVGTYGAQLHWVWALLGIVALQCPQLIVWTLLGEQTVPPDPSNDEGRIAPFVTFLVCTKGTLAIMRLSFTILARFVSSQLSLLLIPVFILCGCCSVGNSSRLLILIQAPFLIWMWASVTLIYRPLVLAEVNMFRKAWSALPKLVRGRYGLLQTMMMIAILIIEMIWQGAYNWTKLIFH